MTAPTALAAELRSLRNQVKGLASLVLFGLAALAFLVYDAARKPLRPSTLIPAPPETLNARELVLRDADGRPRVVAKADDAPGSVALDAAGNERARIGDSRSSQFLLPEKAKQPSGTVPKSSGSGGNGIWDHR